MTAPRRHAPAPRTGAAPATADRPGLADCGPARLRGRPAPTLPHRDREAAR